MQQLGLADVEQIVRIVAEAGDPTLELTLPERKRLLLEGTAQLIEADVWLWSSAAPHPERPTDVVTTCLIDGGWLNEQEQRLTYDALTDVEFNAHTMVNIAADIAACRRVTKRRSEFLSDEIWEQHGGPWRRAGLGPAMLSIYPFSPTSFSGVGFHRRAGKPDFTERETTIVHVVLNQVDWLHRHGVNQPAAEKTFHLSPRLRQVLIYLLRGEAKKQIAAALELSEHTVGDYIKQLHKHFGVGSRAELQAYFFLGEGSERA
jgi:DNA-binding CsgD family transcriptional regulator